jgi:hypothetical protein
MSADIKFSLVFVLLSIIIVYCDKKYGMLRDTSTMTPKPFSFSRVQLAWWTDLVLSSFIAILWVRHDIPTLWDSTLILLGISTTTTAAGRMIDLSDQANPNINRNQDLSAGDNFFLDILSDANGVSIHRLQTVIFNFVFGAWFFISVWKNLKIATVVPDMIMPAITPNNLILLGLSSATYAALKSTENKNLTVPSGGGNGSGGNGGGSSDSVTDEGVGDKNKAQG